MAKEIALSKRAKISQAQQYMLLAVLGASLFLGVAISLVLHFIHQISFNAGVISEEDQAIVTYSNTIKGIGICKKPSGEVYTDEELKKCNPDSVEASSVPGSLRANILESIAASEALNSVPKENASECINPATNKSFTYSEMMELYNSAEDGEQRRAASSLIQICSALRVIPDALPAFKNEEALLSSLNKIFLISGWEPNSLSPTGSSSTSSIGKDLSTFSIGLSVEADSATTIKFLDNVERSIREFDIKRATIETVQGGVLNLSAQADAYYTSPSTLTETSKVIKSGDNEKK
ncbi:hypothetical protein IJJ36_02660 [Candidatus Saccharibacteria bacterium]|nr:hypothetical protein [Candidatus Saccharibacteria bacterium]MBR3263720.1 hypothetical protein [Candidatus Saccharibacteria bacterium]